MTKLLGPELQALYRGHADEDDSGFYSIHAVRDLFDHIDAQEARVAALIAAARAVVAATVMNELVTEDDALGVLQRAGCWCCDRWITPTTGHEEDCPVGALAALLGEAP